MADNSGCVALPLLYGSNPTKKSALISTLSLLLLSSGFVLLLQSPAQGWPSKFTSCIANGCHNTVNADSAAGIITAINGTQGTSTTVPAGATFEVDWRFTGMATSTNLAVGTLLAVPVGWTVAAGIQNSPTGFVSTGSPAINWNQIWDAADGKGWATTNKFTVAQLANADGYTIDFTGSNWDAGNGGKHAALDNGSAGTPGDLDGTANVMGTDARITVPPGTAAGNYTVYVHGIGHNSADTKTYIRQAITVTVIAADNTAPTITAFTMPATASSLSVSINSFTANDNVNVTGYMITESAAVPAYSRGEWNTAAPSTFTFSGAGTRTAYAWAKDAGGNVSPSSSATTLITLDTTPPTAAITYSTQGPYKTDTVVTITATFSEPMADTPLPKIAISGANTLTATDMTKNSTTVYSYPFTVGSGNGSATVDLSTGTDMAGNSVTSAPTSGASFTVDNTAPVISAASPASDSYRNNATAGYTLSKTATSGTITFTRSGGTADSGSPRIYNLVAGDLSIGSHSVNTGLTLVNGTIYTVSFDATDAAGNTATQIASTNVLYDTSAAAVTLSTPGAGSRTNNAIVSYSLSKTIASGQIIYTWTGGTPDATPHTFDLSGAELSSGSHPAVDTGFTLADGAVYAVSVANVLDQAGNQSTTVDNTGVTFDSTAVAITGTAPAAGSFFKAAVVSYTLSEQAASGSVTFTRSGGSDDANSPQSFILTGSTLSAGAHIDIDTALPLVDAAIYTVSFNATDLAGNPATTVSNALTAFDTTAPVLTPVHIASNNADSAKAVVGDEVTVTFTAAESITTPTVTIGGAAAIVSGGPTSWSAIRTVLVSDLLDVMALTISGYSDLSGNAGSTVTTVTDASSVTKIKANANVTAWPTAATITYGQTLASSLLSGGAATPTGSFNFTAPATTPVAGTSAQSVTFTPTDTTNYNPTAGSVNVTVDKTNQAALSVSAPANATFGQTGLTATASGGSGTGAYSYDAGSSTACTINAASGALTITGGNGSCSITATRSADSNYNPSAVSPPATVTIAAASQTITVTTPPPSSAPFFTQFTVAATAPGGTVTYSSASTGVCTNSGDTFTIIAADATCIVQFNQPGNGNYLAAQLTGNVATVKAAQVIDPISFTPSSLTAGGAATASALSTSGLTVSFSTTTPVVCSVSGSTITGITAGSCIITASQPGNASYSAAPDLTQSLTVTSSNLTLTVITSGTGSGTINSNPSGIITCASGSSSGCSATLSQGATITLLPAADGHSLFTGWSGSCTGTGDCILTVNDNSSATATFNINGQATVISGTIIQYGSLQDAYNAAYDGSTVAAHVHTFTENLTLNRPVNITLDLGKNPADETYIGAATGYTTLNGSLTFEQGTVIISNLIIE